MTTTTYDGLNRLVSETGGGLLRFKGQVDEPAIVTINGRPAPVTADNQFQGTAPVTPGTNSVTVSAVDPTGNTATAVYEVDQASSGKTFTYDANGNLTATAPAPSNGMRAISWSPSLKARNEPNTRTTELAGECASAR